MFTILLSPNLGLFHPLFCRVAFSESVVLNEELSDSCSDFHVAEFLKSVSHRSTMRSTASITDSFWPGTR